MWKNKQSSNLRRWRGDKDLSLHFSSRENHPDFSTVFSHLLQPLLATSGVGEKKEKLLRTTSFLVTCIQRLINVPLLMLGLDDLRALFQP